MNKKSIIIVAIIIVIVGVGAFYGGMKYVENSNPRGKFLPADFQNISLEERQQRMQDMGNRGGIRGQ